MKKILLPLAFVIGSCMGARAQSCYTDQQRQKVLKEHPELIQLEAQLEQQMKQALQHIDLSHFAAKGTGLTPGIPPADLDTTFVYDIPIVVHIVHDFGVENLSDDEIFEAVKQWNIVFAMQNTDLQNVIPIFKPYIGNPLIRLHLATKDPLGNPTKGILRHRSYLARNANDQAKYSGWPNNSYLNIWFIRNFSADVGPSVGAYAYNPSIAQMPAYAPYDGVISLAAAITTNKTVNHEIGHCFNLLHVWGQSNDPGLVCGDDGVDDTPPTKGHSQCTAAQLYDTTCSTMYDPAGYFRHYLIEYTDINGNTHQRDTIVDYPDTTNAQNIMDYSFCALNFTKGQVLRMHQALNVNTANRDNLWRPSNLATTGAFAPMPDMAPVPDYSVEIGNVPSGLPPTERTYFATANNPGIKFVFTNRSWNDTVTNVKVHFSNGAQTPDFNLTTATLGQSMINSFSEPGWVNIKMDVEGNGGTSATITKPCVYVADVNDPIDPTMGAWQYQEFNPGTYDKWPIFNYYENEFKWTVKNDVGYYDNTCIAYTGYDTRVFPPWGHYPTGSPKGDFDDFFTQAYKLNGQPAGELNLNFMSSGAFRTGDPAAMNDSLQISYSINGGRTWIPLQSLSKLALANKGSQSMAYQPVWAGDWKLNSIQIPAAARQDVVFFRFRYSPGTDATMVSSGNNFFIDRINVSTMPAGVNTLMAGSNKIAIAPNPTSGAANVFIEGALNGQVEVLVTDVVGRTVYNARQQAGSNYTNIEIPATVLTVKGLYMVQVKTGTETHTEKLLVK